MTFSRRNFVKLVPGLAAWKALPRLLLGSDGTLSAGAVPLPGSPGPSASPTPKKGQTYSQLGYKIYILDFQNSNLDPDTLKNADAEKFGDAMVEMGIETALVYANNVFGLTFFNSQYAPKHRNVSDDFVGEWLAACRKRKIKTVMYHAVYWQEWLAVQHPEWTLQDANGNPVKFTVGTAQQPEAVVTYLCLNSPFREYYMKQVKEIADRYTFDSWFVDEYFFVKYMVCYNPQCVAKWRARTGLDLPHPVPDELYPQYLDFMADTYHSFQKEIIEVLHASGHKNVVVTHNFGLDYRADDYLVMETNPQGSDYYQTSVRTKLYRAYAQGRELQMIPHRGNAYIDFTNAPVERLTWQSAVITSHNAATMWADIGNVDGPIDPIAIRSVKKANQTIDRLIPKVRGTVPYAEVAVMGSERDFILTDNRDYLDFFGANKLLIDMHWPYDVVTEHQLNRTGLAPYRLLILPSLDYLAVENTQEILQYVENGGNLLFCGRGGIYDRNGKPHPLPNLGLVKIVEGHEPRAYVKTLFPIDDERLKSSNIATVEPDPALKVLGTYIEPSVYKKEGHPFLDSPFPGKHTDRPVIVAGRKGKGQWVYVGYRFFEEYIKQDLPVFWQTLRHMVGGFYQPQVWVEGPRVVEAIYNQFGSELRVSLINGITGRPAGEGSHNLAGWRGFNNIVEIIPIYNVRVVVRGKQIRRATNLAGRELPLTAAKGRAVVTLPRLDQYDVITLEWGRIGSAS
jgi:hypothetical protein